eukprot:CAMPEP_0118932444 /NCGR_PEP_ID=MMETSP1169-20130426/10246_1 /TAXON_ID=36882 /ORGANISM="Pyramimonas obovata, Strain CCMP722" /LENGTH=214 /DNA_ID=CAMNT_0006875105 /DNA_START=111 /DNA_END=755 /DNA_ORIENTATION=-
MASACVSLRAVKVVSGSSRGAVSGPSPCRSQAPFGRRANVFNGRSVVVRSKRATRIGRERGAPQLVVASYEYDVESDTMRDVNAPAMPPARVPPPPGRPPPRVPRAMPPNKRRMVFAAAIAMGALLLQTATKDWETPNRRVLVTRDMISDIRMGYNDRVPGDIFFHNSNGQVYYAGADGIRVDTNGDVWAEKTNSKGEVIDLTFISNIRDIRDK